MLLLISTDPLVKYTAHSQIKLFKSMIKWFDDKISKWNEIKYGVNKSN